MSTTSVTREAISMVSTINDGLKALLVIFIIRPSYIEP